MYRLNGTRRLGQDWSPDVVYGVTDWPGAGAEAAATSALTIPSEPFIAPSGGPTDGTTPWWTTAGEIARAGAEIARAVAPIWYPEHEAAAYPSLAPSWRPPVYAPVTPVAGAPRWVWPVLIIGGAGALAWVMVAQRRRRRGTTS